MTGSTFRPPTRFLSRITLIFAAGGFLSHPTPGSAQVCVGLPSSAGNYTLRATLSLDDRSTGYSGEFGVNFIGPVSVGASIGTIEVDDADGSTSTLATGLFYELPIDLPIMVCPVVGISYATWSDQSGAVDVEMSELAVPVGYGIGGVIGDRGRTHLIPWAEAGFAYYRLRASGPFGRTIEHESKSGTEFYFGGGTTVAFGSLFTSAAVSKTTAEASEVVVSLSLGVWF